MESQQFNKFANVFNTPKAAKVFRDHNRTDCVVVRIGKKFGVIKPEFAKKMNLRKI